MSTARHPRSLPKLRVEIIQGPPTALLRLYGEIGLNEIDLLHLHLTSASAMRPKALILDLRGVSSISSFGLGALLQFHRGLRRWGGSLELMSLSAELLDILHSTGLDVVFNVRE